MIQKLKKLAAHFAEKNKSKKLLSQLSDEDAALIGSIREKNLTYLPVRKLVSITETIHELEDRKIPGIFIEAGCALGGSTILIAKLKSTQRVSNVYDVFGMIPSPTEEDTEDVHERYKTIKEGKSKGINSDKYYGYEENLYEIVQSNLKSFGIDYEKESVNLIKGLVQDTMDITEPVAFAHVDVDWYDPVMTCLERIFPKLVIGGSIILDDYHDWGGCRKATDKYLSQIPGEYELDDTYSSLKITRIKN